MSLHTKAVMFRMRVTEAELLVWKTRAGLEGLTVSAWLRRLVEGTPPGIRERPPRPKREKGTPVAAAPPVADTVGQTAPNGGQVAPNVPGVAAVSPDMCRRCGHPRESHWIKGCLAGCPCSEQRYRD